MAVKAHSKQCRKGSTIPYIVHPLRVALTLIKYKCSDEVVAAGILHDTIEDTEITCDDIKRGFGQKVTDLVMGASEPDKSDTWENRKSHTIEFLKTAPKDVLFISCADKLDNITSIEEDLTDKGEAAWTKFKRPREKQKWYYESLVNVFLSRVDDDATSELFNELKTIVDRIFKQS